MPAFLLCHPGEHLGLQMDYRAAAARYCAAVSGRSCEADRVSDYASLNVVTLLCSCSFPRRAADVSALQSGWIAEISSCLASILKSSSQSASGGFSTEEPTRDIIAVMKPGSNFLLVNKKNPCTHRRYFEIISSRCSHNCRLSGEVKPTANQEVSIWKLPCAR